MQIKPTKKLRKWKIRLIFTTTNPPFNTKNFLNPAKHNSI
jgi:hypothetical protein